MNPKFFVITTLMLLPFASATAAEEEAEAWDVNAIPGDSRDVTIDTRTGSWMSVDVSPDGETIAFDLLGDIYVLPIAGGEAKSINSGHAWSMQPRFSPDGSEIAFTSDAGGGDNIWIMQVDGSDARQLTKEDFRLLNNPYWSPDGQYIAAKKHFTTTRSAGTGEIWLYHRNGGGGVAVVERPNEMHQKALGETAISPDGRYIYYSLDQTPGGSFEYAQDSNGEVMAIRRFDLETGENEAYISGAGGAVRPTPSPDGKYLAFVRRIRGESALFLKDLSSGAEFAIYEGLDKDLQEVWGTHGAYPGMDWMPDSKSVVFWAGGGIKRVDINSKDVVEIAFHVKDTRSVYDPPRPKVEVAPASFQTTMVRNVEVSPDGSKVVFESAGRIYMKSLPDGDAKRLTRDASDHFEYDPSWSRDGKTIAFITWDDNELANVHSVRASGGRSKRLTKQPGHYHAPRFSPNGESVVYWANSGGYLTSPDWSMQTGVFLVPAAGGDSRLVTADGSNPHFGARSDRIYVTRRGEGGRALVSVDLNGEKPRTHASGEHLVRYEVAPDDSHFAFRQNYQIFALPLPPGGKPLSLSTTASSVNTTQASGDGGNYPHWINGGRTLAWTLGATLFDAHIDDLFVLSDAEEDGYEAPSEGLSLSIELRADVPSTVVALTGARIVTMADEQGGVIEDGVVVVDGNRISAVGSATDVAIPEGARLVDVAGKTIIPGLIDAHAHGSAGVGMIPEQNWMAYATLAFGVTTVHDPSNDAREIFAAAEMQRTGTILAPRIFSTGDIVYGARSTYFADINSLDDARAHVRRLKAQGAGSIKNYNQPRREQRQQVTTAAREEGMLVVSEGGSQFHMDLSMVADGNSAIEHNLPQSMLYDDVLQFWSQTKVAYTPTLGVTYGGLSGEDYWYQQSNVWEHPILSRFVPPHILQPRSVRRVLAPDGDYYHMVSAATAKLMADQGVMVSIGAHGQREGLASHWEMWGFAQGGMSPLQALQAATSTPAKALGYDDDLGSIEVGKLADLVVLDANILEDIFKSDQVNMVMLNGRLYDSATMNEKVTGSRTTQPFYWQ
jgi:imidazolonepropionase-like amidohydrolase/Tol biopolymer transport system component